MKLKIFITVFTAMFLWNCSSDEPMVNITAQETEMQTSPSSRYLSPEEACNEARHMIVELNLSSPSRAKRTTTVYHYTPSSLSRNAERDTMFYVVNFEGGGFALIDANRKAFANTVAISATGTFEENDNPAFQEYAEAYVKIDWDKKYKDPRYELKTVDPNPNPWMFDSEGYQIGVFENTYTHENFINVAWEQGYPYNIYCTPLSEADNNKVSEEYKQHIYMGHGLVGCVPVAIGQICSYNKKPSSIYGRNIDWAAITSSHRIYNLTSSAKDMLAFFLGNIGKPINLKHGLSTGVRIDDTMKCIKAIGYTNASRTSDITKCFNALENKEVVYMQGFGSSSGHAWVVDGYKKHVKTWRRFEKGSSTVSHIIRTEITNYLAFNWGWGSTDHVYYIADGHYDTGVHNQNNENIIFDKNFEYIVNFK